MLSKTKRLVSLFPDAYSAKDKSALLHKLLDAVGAELMAADEALKQLLQSHWVNYASGKALDGLAAIYNIARRRLRDGTLESDQAFQQRLRAIVPLFTGGGTKQAVIGAVRSALGLPFDLNQLNLPPVYDGLRNDLENLVYLEEFSPKGERLVSENVREVDNASEIELVFDVGSVGEGRPTILWTFHSGGGRNLRIERQESEGVTFAGVQSTEDLVIPPGSTLRITSGDDKELVAFLGLEKLNNKFKDINDPSAIKIALPDIPKTRSVWKFRARSGVFGAGASRMQESVFDRHDTFDLPRFGVEVNWLILEPLTFEVHVPYFLKRAVEELKTLHNFNGNLFVYEGLPLDAVAEVVRQTRAAGVRAGVQFSLSFSENHTQMESLERQGQHRYKENADVLEGFSAASVQDIAEQHDVSDAFIVGGVFDISPFDKGHGME